MKFLCDEMFKGLARWLRAAGYDTDIAKDGQTDRELIQQARATNRQLITRDHKLMEFKNAYDTVRLLHCTDINSCALALKGKTSLNWLHHPFSRCLLCNTPIMEVKDVSDVSVPGDVKNSPLFQCPDCKRIYWSGGHVKRIREKLERWERSA